MLLYLSHRIPRQAVHTNKRFRSFERSERATAYLLQRRHVQRIITDDVGNRHFTPALITPAANCYLSYSRLLRQNLLDFAWIDIETAADDQIGSSSFQRVIPIL